MVDDGTSGGGDGRWWSEVVEDVRIVDSSGGGGRQW